MQCKEQADAKNSPSYPISKGKVEGLILVGLLATGAFDLVMYADIAVTGMSLEIPSMLGNLVLGENQFAEPVGRLIHLGNGIGLALLFGFIALPLSRKLIKLPTIVYGIVFAIVETIVAVWFGMLPALGAGIAGINMGPEVAIVTILRHIAFGIVLGVSVRRWNS